MEYNASLIVRRLRNEAMRLRLFYGWYIVVAGMVLSAYSNAIFGYGWTAFVNPIVATFGWSMTQLSLASSLRSLETGMFNPVWGAVVDRYPPRRLVIFALIITALGVFLLSQTKNLAMFYGGFLLMGLGSSLATHMLPTTLITKWFRRDIGKANGVFFMGAGIGGILVPLVVKIVDKLSWQTTLFYAAIGFLVLGILPSVVFRSPPEDSGSSPGGKVAGVTTEASRTRNSEVDTGVREALKTRAFWQISLVFFLQSIRIGPMMLYMMPYLTGLGVDRTTASTFVMLYTMVSLGGRIPMGALADIFKKSYIIATSMGMMGAGLFILSLIDSHSPFWLILLFAIVYGVGLSGEGALRAPIVAEYFGRRHFGAIFGSIMLSTTIGSVVATPLAGWVYDTYGSYQPVLLALIAVAAMGVILILTIPAATTRARAAVS